MGFPLTVTAFATPVTQHLREVSGALGIPYLEVARYARMVAV